VVKYLIVRLLDFPGMAVIALFTQDGMS